ncbi:MAG: peptide methionine sulfoxide reductase [Porticoccaceae bacterium]|nr:peptide methionine sulfoxide reductase [Porticoccaceae bacterium]
MTSSIAASTPKASQDEVRATYNKKTIVVAAGCFWGAEKMFSRIPGVIDVVSGYANGKGVDATYRAITLPSNRMNPNNHAEAVRVTYDSNAVNLRTLLESFFEYHDPTQVNRQGNDVGTQYRSMIFTTNKEQVKVANKTLDEFQTLLSNADFGEIATKIIPLTHFTAAEPYHQNYLQKNPNGYCPDNSTGISFDSVETEISNNNALLEGKQILIIESSEYCPYCEKLKNDITDQYAGSIPISFRTAKQLDGLSIKTPTWATPTIIFLDEGTEAFGFQGYMEPKDFYYALGKFSLGEGKVYQVAFENGTDQRFCKEYEIFKNVKDGIFVDKLSGAALFDTNDRFDSKTGWLSFKKSVDGAVYERRDISYGMIRTEIRSVSSDIHLGHVFSDGPNGARRYCINATVLNFIPKTPSG